MLSKAANLITRRYHAVKKTNNTLKQHFQKKLNTVSPLEMLIDKHKDKLVYNSIIASRIPSFFKRKVIEAETKKFEEIIQCNEPLPVFLKYLEPKHEQQEVADEVENVKCQVTHFPFSDDNLSSVSLHRNSSHGVEETESIADNTEKEIRAKQKAYKNLDFSTWMSEYENFDDSEVTDIDKWKINYGTPDPRSEISNVPCGGCGALLHCRDTSIPGYLPSEIFKNSFKPEGEDLKSIVCQRCHFLNNFNLALQVRVSSGDYPQVLETLRTKKALVILMVDLLDFPGSVWPNMGNLIGLNKPIIIVGNKVDLIPADPGEYLKNILDQLKEKTLERMTDDSSHMNIKDVCLISAKSGYGVEELITKIHNIWGYSGDIYLVGCTNVGKSTLFNCLLQSDLCKVQAVDLVQRATTSVWPGTTLNLLKFPILRPSGWRLYARTKRLNDMQKLRNQERKLKKFSNSKNTTTSILDMVNRTFTPDNTIKFGQTSDLFVSKEKESDPTRIGIDENDPLFIRSKWCYDTPGVVQPDQIIHLLTTEELMLTLPKEEIRPRTFNIRLGQTLFIAGIARVDYLEGPSSTLITVFSSKNLPITMCNTPDANQLYEELLGTDLLRVPAGTNERLSQWPSLKAESLTLSATQTKTACTDIVLSSAGWISVTSPQISDLVFKAWTPESRGIFVRKALLPYAAYTRGTKMTKSPAYANKKPFISK